jgi:type 1 glutamine amidotransferase
MKKISSIILYFLTVLSCFSQDRNHESIQVLLLSGSNNHNWRQTTPLLESIYKGSSLFEVEITNQPDTLVYKDLKKFDAILSNWNSWPDNNLRWPEETENGILKYLEEGGGLVFFHSSTSAFYTWPEFKKISTGAWVEDTWHGRTNPTKVTIENQEHPITKGLSGFYIFDELWINAEQNDRFQVLGNAINEEALDKVFENQPAIFVSDYGKGRIFHTLLGHDTRAMRNTGFQTLMLRGTEWAATSKVSLPIPKELQQKKPIEIPKFNWLENDSTFALIKNNQVLWQYNFNTKYGKSFFHPVYLDRNLITCLSPGDHPWHLGQWFSWKYINGINYWEYAGSNYELGGITDITSIKLKKNNDYSAQIYLTIDYYPTKGQTVLREERIIRVFPPHKDGRVQMDYDMNFKAVAEKVELNRTPPIAAQTNGKLWGGYSGMSVRFNQDFTNESILSSGGINYQYRGIGHERIDRFEELAIINFGYEDIDDKTGDWFYMGFTGLDGKRVGTVIMIQEDTKGEGEAWYSVNTPAVPFYYINSAYVYLKPQSLAKGESINLRYRVLHIEGNVNKDVLNNEYKSYTINNE